MNVAVIPARGGSKRIPGKNIKPFFGKPMIQYSIEAALKSELFDRVIVTTDSDEIAAVARSAGAEVPSLRPAELSNDHVATAPVIVHALKEMVPEGARGYQYACLILATAPFLQPDFLKKGFQQIRSKKVASVIAVTTYEFPILRSMKVNEKGHLEWMWPEYELTRSNDLPEALHDAGQFYWLDIPKFLKSERVVSPDSLPIRLPRHLVQDIDTPEDWAMAEALYKSLNK